MTSEISREEFEVEFRRLEGEWEVLKKEAGIDIAYDIQVKSKERENLEINNAVYSDTVSPYRKIQKIINISAIISGGLNLIQIPFVTIPVITAVQLNMLYQINRKYNVETGIKMLIGNVIATVGILLFLQTISPQLTNLIYFPGKYIFGIVIAIVVKLTGTAHLETLKNILDN